MVEGNRDEPSLMDIRAKSTNKRKPSANKAHRARNDHRKKRRRSTLSSEIVIRTSSEPPILAASNRFEPIRSPSRKHEKRRSSQRDGNRRWVYSARDCSKFIDKIMVASYNILGVENASKHPDLYHRVPSKFLNWSFRKELICNAIKFYNAGILCLQEVDRFNDLDELFQKYGYKGVYKARTGEANDGCAVFWIDKLFTLLHQETIEFQSFGLRNNVAQLCVLKMNQSESKLKKSRTFLIGNIHVLFNPNRGDIKLGQVRLFLEKAHSLSQRWGNIPVIMGGDLNSIPKLDIQLHDRRKISGQLDFLSSRGAFRFSNESTKWLNVSASRSFRWSNEELRIASGGENVTCLQHHLKLSSAYHGVPGSFKTRDANGEPLVTSFHSKFMGTVDYIWHSEELVPVRVLETLPVDALKKTGGLPSEKWGSDHLALVCELAFDDDGNGLDYLILIMPD
ncbi:carbon catabolite repressor protein 4 homolog 5-like [Momordica charantia]|uniref:Carbon catabolite repressor protein 4 homolog 5-like n=1 Tax=Momordica charantia TaxID=3673 RepID=A0A6J1C0M3_MOMCH|nr:carbon catabolite repressor protein 4 homolog 5-like [Momordica charantia]XP_022135391.1 carbon catabolite repressor protein 4 homolog 5-like [Momordica charantia]